MDEEADQIIAISILLYRIDVEIVKWSRLCSHICDGIVGLVQCNVLASIPGEYYFLNDLSDTKILNRSKHSRRTLVSMLIS